MGSAQKQGELWGHGASDWATLQEVKHIPLFEAMLSAARVDNGTRFFDAGCGGGGASVLAAQRGAQVSALDAAESLVDIARTRVPSGDFRIGDLEALPFGDDAFDSVIAANSIQYTQDRVAALRELRRVCAPGGRVVVSLFGPPETFEYRHILKAVRDVMPEPPPGDGPFGLSAPGTLEGLIEEAGLNVMESAAVNCPFMYPDFQTFWQACASAGPIRGMIGAVGADKIKAATREAVKMFLTNEGRVEIGPNIFKYVVAAVQ